MPSPATLGPSVNDQLLQAQHNLHDDLQSDVSASRGSANEDAGAAETDRLLHEPSRATPSVATVTNPLPTPVPAPVPSPRPTPTVGTPSSIAQLSDDMRALSTRSQATKLGLAERLEGKDLLVRTEGGDVLNALRRLDEVFRKRGEDGIISNMSSYSAAGTSVGPGQIGLYVVNSQPKVITKRGNYTLSYKAFSEWAPNPVRNLTDQLIEFNNLSIVNVGANSAAVVLKPDQQISIVEEGGFVAFGAYKVLGIVNKNELATAVQGTDPNDILVKYQNVMNGRALAAIFLQVNTGNVAVLQRGNELVLWPQGHHCIVGHEETFYTALSLRLDQRLLPRHTVITRDQVTVSVALNLQWRLTDPQKFLRGTFKDPYDALRYDAEGALMAVVGNLAYGEFIGQVGKAGGAAQSFTDTITERVKDDLAKRAEKQGIEVVGISIQERQFSGKVADAMNELSIQTIQNTAKQAILASQNANRVLQAQGDVKVAELEAQAAAAPNRVNAETGAYKIGVDAKANAEGDATRIRARYQAEAEGIKLLVDTYNNVPAGFAQEMLLARNMVERINALAASGGRLIIGDFGASNVVGTALNFGLGTQLSSEAKDSHPSS